MTHLMDLKNNSVSGSSIRPQACSTSGGVVYGDWIDCLDVAGPITARAVGGVFTSPGTCAIFLQEAIENTGSYNTALNSDASSVSDGAFTTMNASNTSESILVKGTTKRFVRAVANTQGASGSLLLSVEIFGQKKIVGTAGGYSVSPQS